MGRQSYPYVEDESANEARKLKQQIAEVRKRLEAARDRPPLTGPGIMEIAQEMDRLIVQYTKLDVERKRRAHKE